MQNLKFSHINNRFKERFGREFTQRDKRTILQMVANEKAEIRVSRDDKEKYIIYCIYEGRPTLFVLGRDNTFITCFDANSSYRKGY